MGLGALLILQQLSPSNPHLLCVVLGRLKWRALRCGVAPGHTTVDDKVGTIDEAALIAGEEENTLGLLDGLTEPAGGEVHLTTESFGLIITQPVLQKRCAIIVSVTVSDIHTVGETYFRGAGHRALKRNPSRA